MDDALRIVRELLAVGLVNERVKALMGLHEFRRHGGWSVEGGECAGRIGGAGVEDRLRGGDVLDTGGGRGATRPAVRAVCGQMKLL